MFTCLFMLTLWVLGGNNNAEALAGESEENAAQAVMDEILIPTAQTSRELSYEEVMLIRNNGYACPTFSALGYDYQGATIRHDQLDSISVELILTKGQDDQIKVTETRHLYGKTPVTENSSTHPFADPSRYAVVTELPIPTGAVHGTFSLGIETADAEYTVESVGSKSMQDQVINYIAMADQARVQDSAYRSDHAGERFGRGFQRLIGQE